MHQLTLKNVCVHIAHKTLLTNINITWFAGQLQGIIGPNGAGKSTLLKAIAQIQNYSGSIHHQHHPKLSHKMAYVPQLSQNKSALTVFETVLLGLVKQLTWRVAQHHLDAVEQILHQHALIHLSHQPFNALSGGQKQLVMLAQALISTPSLLLLDEPISALDLHFQLAVLERIQAYTLKHKTLTLIILHDLSLAMRYCQTLTLIDHGVITKHGPTLALVTDHMLSQTFKVDIETGLTPTGYAYVIPTKHHPS